MGRYLLVNVLGPTREKLLAILAGPEDGLALVPAIPDVINRPGILDAQFERHAKGIAIGAQSVNSEDLLLLLLSCSCSCSA